MAPRAFLLPVASSDFLLLTDKVVGGEGRAEPHNPVYLPSGVLDRYLD